MDKENAFEGLDDTFDTEFECIEDSNKNELIEIQEEVTAIEKKKDDLKENIIKIDDSDFLEEEIKSLLITSKKMLQRLDSDIRIGSGPRMYEVYSSMVNSITAQIKELRQLHEANAKLSVDNKKDIGNMNQNDKISLTTNQLLDMVINAKENSEIKKIDADFEIEDEVEM